MKKNLITIAAFVFTTVLFTTGCKPNGNNNSTDVHNSMRSASDPVQPLNEDTAFDAHNNIDTIKNGNN
ncbi:MAG: hypothetical protein M3040_02460 [Bacteroidota bacterium]|nr:hypothetical protein [Bacteroidota bacterium]